MSTTAIVKEKTKEPPVHIASIIAHMQPEFSTKTRDWLNAQPYAEVHTERQGKLVVVLETESERKIHELLDDLAALPGALSAVLVYHEIVGA
ncbi:MAG: chaperone NapD [Cellvibrionaceae bacterium]|nr:chaperone NapD [Cellvibrionaceae bacterium]